MAGELPKTFALKSNHNNKYLAYIKDESEGHGLLKFSGEELSPLALFHAEKAKSGNGLVHLKSSYNNKYLTRWSQNHYWVAAEADAPEEDQSKPSCTLFKPQFKDGDGKTLQLLLPGQQKELAHEPFTHCLSSTVETNVLKTLHVFTVVNYVLVSKNISGIRLNLKEAKITSQTTVTDLPKAVVRNVNDKSNEEKVIKLEYNKSESSTWILGSNAVNLEVITNIRSAIPVIIKGNIELTGDEFTGPYQWGTTVESTHRVQTTYKVNVPPMTTLIVAPEATRATFEVPFSYTQEDTLHDGLRSTSNMEDGIYRGVGLFNFRYQVRQDKIRA